MADPYVLPMIERLVVLEISATPGRPYRRLDWSDEQYAEYLRGWNEGQRRGQGWML